MIAKKIEAGASSETERSVEWGSLFRSLAIFFGGKKVVCWGAMLITLLVAQMSAAETAPVWRSSPGFYRMALGQFEVTALHDGESTLSPRLLKNVMPGDMSRLLARQFIAESNIPLSVNAYLINTGTNLVLVDAGAANRMGDSLGQMQDNLRASGYLPEQVDTVVLTHLHGDHIGGLLDTNGNPVFINATVFVSEDERGYWLSEKQASAAPEALRAIFSTAREVATPYQALGHWRTFEDGQEIVPGIRATEASGHTPGHTAFSVDSGGQSLLILGDVVHAYAIQFARPAVSIDYDLDAKQAISTRKHLLKALAENRSLVAGMHLPFPGLGHVRAEGREGFSWVPIDYRAQLPVPPGSPVVESREGDAPVRSAGLP